MAYKKTKYYYFFRKNIFLFWIFGMGVGPIWMVKILGVEPMCDDEKIKALDPCCHFYYLRYFTKYKNKIHILVKNLKNTPKVPEFT
jgi:hypothetical protein